MKTKRAAKRFGQKESLAACRFHPTFSLPAELPVLAILLAPYEHDLIDYGWEGDGEEVLESRDRSRPTLTPPAIRQ